jgi:hypothetical protein
MVKLVFSRRLPALLVAGAAVGCTAIVGVDQDYELDPGAGKAGSVATGGAGSGGSGGSERGGAAGSGGIGTGGAPSTDGGEDAGGASGRGGATDASAGAAGTSGSGGTGGASGGGGTGGASGSAGTGGTSGSAGTGGASGSAGTAGSGGTGTAGSAGTGGAAGNAGASGGTGAGGSAVDAGDGGDGDAAGGSGGASPDASSDPAIDSPQDVGSPCGPGTKFCGVCVPTADPNYGCANASCAPCEPNGTATCTSGNCVVTGCNPGYHQVGNACVVNVPEVCTNGVDDDGDTRADCLDSDCASDSSCGGKCMDAMPVACDTILTAQNTSAAGSTARISGYSCSGGTYIASEYAYRFTGGANQRVYAEIYGLSGNLGLFEIGVPSGSQCMAGTSCGAYSDGATGTGAEALGFTTQPGQDYFLVVDGTFLPRSYALSVQCSTLDGCWPRRPIEAGQSFNATNNPASGAINVTASKVPSYNCGTVNIGETGPEAAWMFTPTVTANYRASLTALSADCDLFVLPATDCGGSCLGPTTYSANFNQTSEFVTFPGVANTTYYIVVEGYADAICTFTIGLMQL